MALRVVLAVVVSVALLAVSVPAVEEARTDRTAASLDAATDHLRTAGARLRATSDVTAVGPAARTVVSLDLPTRGWGARAGSLRVDDGELAWRVGDGPWHVERAPHLAVPDGPLVVSGSARLVFTHRVRDGRPVVVVRRGLK
ncbi:DUF7311 family protein [Halomarina oriensis]|uniref:DUF7311 domain-containing protein n=1 Tax=Halomarina oriensis TaxID=671145 RepID=A0A6B0GLB6_9EURY|nr:hypothetical protein [Halomarina oriensis]MWG35430.1 hypothetical protein [Halomarina oriensis]